jgi:hypothetical protein
MVDQLLGHTGLVLLARRQRDVERLAFRRRDRMDLETTSGASRLSDAVLCEIHDDWAVVRRHQPGRGGVRVRRS